MRDQRVAFRDFDYFRHVNNAAYITWTETLRIEYMTEVVGVPPDARVGIIMAAQRFEYLAPIAYGETVSVACRTARIGSKSFDIAYEVANTATGVLAATGSSTVVAYDYDKNASVPIPPEWRERIARFEAGETAPPTA